MRIKQFISRCAKNALCLRPLLTTLLEQNLIRFQSLVFTNRLLERVDLKLDKNKKQNVNFETIKLENIFLQTHIIR